jgi:hypothetical protein
MGSEGDGGVSSNDITCVRWRGGLCNLVAFIFSS